MAPTALLSLESATLNNTVGALFLGVLAAMFLFGITTLQTYRYYRLYPKDSQLHKYSVAVLWVLDALHLALTIQAVYIYIVTGFGDRLGMENILWSIKLQVLVNVVIILIVHSLYALRVWILGGYHQGIIGYLVALVIAGGFAIGVVLTYHLYKVHTYAELENISWVVIAALATSTGIDFVITAAMCYYLWRIQTPTSRLNETISTIIQYSLGSGLFTSACSLSALFTYILLPDTLIFLGLQFLLTKLYFFSFLTMLHARKRTVTTIHVSTDANITEVNQSGTPITELVPRRYQALRNKFLCSLSIGSNTSSQAQAHIRVQQVRPTTSSFWSPPPPPTLGDEEQGYQDCLPPIADVEDRQMLSPRKSQRSLSDGSETIRGTWKGPSNSVSPTSADTLLASPLQRPASIYDREPQVNSSVRASADVRPLSTSYPWHAR